MSILGNKQACFKTPHPILYFELSNKIGLSVHTTPNYFVCQLVHVPTAHLPFGPCAHSPFCPCAHVPMCPCAHVPMSPCPHLSICPSVYLSIWPSDRLTVWPSDRLSVCPSVHLSICPSVCLSVFHILSHPPGHLATRPSGPMFQYLYQFFRNSMHVAGFEPTIIGIWVKRSTTVLLPKIPDKHIKRKSIHCQGLHALDYFTWV
jgi:hypothetical protein